MNNCTTIRPIDRNFGYFLLCSSSSRADGRVCWRGKRATCALPCSGGYICILTSDDSAISSQTLCGNIVGASNRSTHLSSSLALMSSIPRSSRTCGLLVEAYQMLQNCIVRDRVRSRPHNQVRTLKISAAIRWASISRSLKPAALRSSFVV